MNDIFLFKKVITAFLLPPAGLLLLAFFGLWLVTRQMGRQRAVGMALLGVSLIALLALATPAVGKRLLASLENSRPISAEQLVKVQAIVVLAGGLYHDAPEYGGDTVKNYSLERLRYAARLAKVSSLPLLLTGGTPSGGKPESVAMREVLTQEFGVEVKWIEMASRDTAENAKFSALQLKRAGINKIALVSHVWHLPRAVPLFEREGLEVTPAPTMFSTASETAWVDWLPNDFRNSRNALHEHLGRLFDQVSQFGQ